MVMFILCYRPLGQDFTVRFAQIFNVQIVQWPESITIEVSVRTWCYSYGELITQNLNLCWMDILGAW